MNKVKRLIRNPYSIFRTLSTKGLMNWVPDAVYLKLIYRGTFGKKLNLKDPKTFNEKSQWLKLYNRDPLYIKMVDKYEAKEYIASIIGQEYIIPTLGVWDHFDEIDFEKLPDQFVLKCTHDSGGVVICKDKKKLDIVKAKEKLEKSLKTNYFWYGREWPYKNVKPRIIAEKLLLPADNQELIEYKLFCFNGEPRITLICKGQAHSSIRTNSAYDLDFNLIPVDTVYPRTNTPEKAPEQFDEMILISKKLSRGLPFVRVDLYICNEQIFVGELTLYHNSGFCPFDPQRYDEELGSLIDIEQYRMDNN